MAFRIKEIMRIAKITAWSSLIFFFFAHKALAFEETYRYRLVYGKKAEVCRHMLGVYNKSFTKPWSEKQAKGQAGGDEQYWETQYARFPTSPEFEAILWKVHPYKVNENPHSALYAKFDIDNDGTGDDVLRMGFFNGSPGSWDYISVFPVGVVDLDQFKTQDDFLTNIAPKRKSVLGYPVHQRPFIYKGRTYLHGYTFTPRNTPGADAAEPFSPPEYLLIREYLGGAANDAELQEMSMKLICKFEMIQSATSK